MFCSVLVVDDTAVHPASYGLQTASNAINITHGHLLRPLDAVVVDFLRMLVEIVKVSSRAWHPLPRRTCAKESQFAPARHAYELRAYVRPFLSVRLVTTLKFSPVSCICGAEICPVSRTLKQTSALTHSARRLSVSFAPQELVVCVRRRCPSPIATSLSAYPRRPLELPNDVSRARRRAVDTTYEIVGTSSTTRSRPLCRARRDRARTVRQQHNRTAPRNLRTRALSRLHAAQCTIPVVFQTLPRRLSSVPSLWTYQHCRYVFPRLTRPPAFPKLTTVVSDSYRVQQWTRSEISRVQAGSATWRAVQVHGARCLFRLFRANLTEMASSSTSTCTRGFRSDIRR